MLRTAYQHLNTFPISATDLAPLDAFLGALLEQPQPGRVRVLRRARCNIARLPAAHMLRPAPRIVVAQCNTVPAGEMSCTREWVSFWLGSSCCEFWSGETFYDPLGTLDGTSSSALLYTCRRDGDEDGMLTAWLAILTCLDPRQVTITTEQD